MVIVSLAKQKRLQEKVLGRYKDNARSLPRRRTKDPYKILVSEIMLQQTQVERVKTKYKLWLEQFPTISDLAKASQVQILTLWSGLGYNRRGINLWRAAQMVVKEHAGKIPRTGKELLALPGVGPYTAHAVMAFSRNEEVPVLDINIKRVLITELKLDPTLSDKELRAIAQQVIPAGRSRDWHNALMDYGALVLTSKKTGIRSAPQSQFVGSTRWVRGNIIKLLITNDKLLIKDMKRQFPHEKFDEIVEGMVKEGIISKKNEIVWLTK